MEKITIFTPTYNRANTLVRLYDSLISQSCKEFIWLIIDDGSTDDTPQLVKKWMELGSVKIEYHKQTNSGKSLAHNKGVEFTKTDLFTCVDSDDYLINTAIEDLLIFWNSNEKSDRIVGILAYKGMENKGSLTSIKNNKIKTTTLKNAYEIHGLIGDAMLIYKTEIISKYKFPSFDNEKFVPEAFLYDLIDQEGELLLFPKVIYICEYLEDGYTKNMTKLLAANPKGYIAFIKQRLHFDKSISEKFLDSIKFTAMCISNNEKHVIKNSVYPIITVLTYPLGYYLYLKKYKKHKNIKKNEHNSCDKV